MPGLTGSVWGERVAAGEDRGLFQFALHPVFGDASWLGHAAEIHCLAVVDRERVGLVPLELPRHALHALACDAFAPVLVRPIAHQLGRDVFVCNARFLHRVACCVEDFALVLGLHPFHDFVPLRRRLALLAVPRLGVVQQLSPSSSLWIDCSAALLWRR